MLAYYRGHIILLLQDDILTAEITERASGAPLPTKISALPGETADIVVEKAKHLIDKYLRGVLPL
ncbi:hypothetical protein [uncultured Devosia sp.]|uniref:hypothetical protein n=1 Tax=uncultured Devosia sp. TaxID=211434 RepID=UPI0035C986FB